MFVANLNEMIAILSQFMSSWVIMCVLLLLLLLLHSVSAFIYIWTLFIVIGSLFYLPPQHSSFNEALCYKSAGKRVKVKNGKPIFQPKIQTFRPRKMRQALTVDPAGPYLQQMFWFLAEILGQIRLLYTFISAIWNLPALRPLAEL